MLVEYFVSVGCGRARATVKGGGISVQLEPVVLDRWPDEETSDGLRSAFPFPPGLGFFALPDGAQLVASPPPLPRFFTFATTASTGANLFGSCLWFYEPAPEALLNSARLASMEAASSAATPSAMRKNRLTLDQRVDSSNSPSPKQKLSAVVNGFRSEVSQLVEEDEEGQLSEAKSSAKRNEMQSVDIRDDDEDDDEFFDAASNLGDVDVPLKNEPILPIDNIDEKPEIVESSTASVADTGNQIKAGGMVFNDDESGKEDGGGDIKPDGDQVEYFKSSYVWYAPKCICLLSRWPFFGFFRRVLTHLYRVSLSPSPLPVERYIAHVLREVPVPPRGRIQVQFSIEGLVLLLSRQRANDPLGRAVEGHSLKSLLFERLATEKIILVLEAMLLERTILLLSKHYSLLTPAAEAFRSLMYPFSWHHVYIPLLPRVLLDFLSAPMPFLLGTHASFVPSYEDLPDNLVVVDLDSNAVVMRGRPPRLPTKERTKLIKMLMPISAWQEARFASASFNDKHKSVAAQEIIGVEDEQDLAFQNAPRPDEVDSSAGGLAPEIASDGAIRAAFFRVFVSVFKDYSQFTIVPKNEVEPPRDLNTIGRLQLSLRRSRHHSVGELFQIEEFLATHPSTSHRFLRDFMATQAFLGFIERKICNDDASDDDPIDVRYFDESIIAKQNRSAFSKKQPTPFLDDKTTNIRNTFVVPVIDGATKPTSASSPIKYVYDNWPDKLDREVMKDVKIVKPLGNDNESTGGRIGIIQRHSNLISMNAPLSAERAQRSIVQLWFQIATIVACSNGKKSILDQAIDILSARRVILSDLSVYRMLIEACGKCQAPEKSLRVLAVMQEDGWNPDASVYASLFTAFSADGDLSRAYNTLGRLKKRTPSASMSSNPNISLASPTISRKTSRDDSFSERACIKRFERAVPGLTIAPGGIEGSCPECNEKLTDAGIRAGWVCDPNAYTTACEACGERFVHRFVVYVNGDLIDVDPTFDKATQAASSSSCVCEYLPPLALHKEIAAVMRDKGADQGLQGTNRSKIMSYVGAGAYLCSREFRQRSPASFWSMLWHFTNYSLPISFLVPWLRQEHYDRHKALSLSLRNRRSSK